ncbi:hypothetical protein [Gemmata sp.]|uniref:hypothetical protein n=1 Tax=Gemmata sp. TaxID=1914242 RepID=UPI003F72292C
MRDTSDDLSLARVLVGDGRPLLAVSGLVLAFAGAFAVFVAARCEFLPHDVAFLGMTPQSLCAVHGCRVVHFMVHDRVAFGGALVAVGVVYVWLALGPMSRGEWWAWQVTAASGAVGFASFLTYLGYGYLDTWHGAATAALAPLFLAGLGLSRRRVNWAAGSRQVRPPWECSGRVALLLVAAGMVCGGATIAVVGMTRVFVPEDLAFLAVTREELDALSGRLVPLIAHDRAGFGGAVCCCGVLLAGVAWNSAMERAAREALAVAGAAGFGAAILVHPAIGYDDLWHLTPALAGAGLYAWGLCRVAAARTP